MATYADHLGMIVPSTCLLMPSEVQCCRRGRCQATASLEAPEWKELPSAEIDKYCCRYRRRARNEQDRDCRNAADEYDHFNHVNGHMGHKISC